MLRVRSQERGFSLIELLTVIAIIAILAGIIFPVMTSVKNRANQAKCMTNMMNIAKAIKMYKLDNRKFPDRLAAVQVETNPVAFDRMAGRPSENALMGDYQMKTAEPFRCPTSKNTDYNEVLQDVLDPWEAPVDIKVKDASGNLVRGLYYAVDDYDTQRESDGNYRMHYTTQWARITAPSTPVEWAVNSSGATAVTYDPILGSLSGEPLTAVNEEDYRRQLCWRDPPDDTVVTWCSNHGGSKDTVLFLSGNARPVDKVTVENCRWRTRPPRS